MPSTGDVEVVSLENPDPVTGFAQHVRNSETANACNSDGDWLVRSILDPQRYIWSEIIQWTCGHADQPREGDWGADDRGGTRRKRTDSPPPTTRKSRLSMALRETVGMAREVVRRGRGGLGSGNADFVQLIDVPCHRRPTRRQRSYRLHEVLLFPSF